MRYLLITLLAGLLSTLPARADLTLADGGKTRYVIVQDPAASTPERNAAKELAETLEQITGAKFPIQVASNDLPRRAILVGKGALTRRLAPDVAWDKLGLEEIVVRTKGNRLILAGGDPRGTLYAVSHFLQDSCGVRWWTPWASHIPTTPKLKVGDLNVRYQPPFESRDPFWYPAFDARWAVRNFSNSQSANIPEEWGNCIRYKGFVHTFYPLVPPEEHFEKHPEWYSLLNGKRTTKNAQLCLSNPELRNFVTDKVRQWLRESPQARIISISQNDWHGNCQCDGCRAIDDREESPSGSLLDFVNDIASRLEAEFPLVAFDTLAYQYTRKPPKTIKPRPSVIIRLCSIECNFRVPLDAPENKKFAGDIRGWAKICQRLYIWDYTTDFGHYVQPHPNWYTLGANVRFFRDHNVRGLFEQGAYQAFGSEMTELRSWVLARLLWNPALDDRALINEFLEGYYGKAAAPLIRSYFDLMYRASEGFNLTCFSRTDTPFFNFATLVEAERLWNQAEAAVATDPGLLPRVKLARLPLHYVWLSRWEALRKECVAANAQWPLPASRKAVADAWLKTAHGLPGAPWTKLALINESGLTPEKFVERFQTDPPEPAKPAATPQPTPTAPAKELPKVKVAPNGKGFVTSNGQPFVPFGLSYFRPHTGWAPQVWKKFDPQATRADFAKLRQLGLNCVRVFLSYGSFFNEADKLSPEGVAAFDQFLTLAEQEGIYVHPTGPDHWEGQPAWARTDRLADEAHLQALERFWTLLATRYRGRHALFAYDLLNEPAVGWDTPAMRAKWGPWLEKQYGSLDALTRAWKLDPAPQSFASIAVPPAKPAPDSPALLDYQHFRESIATEWTRRQAAAIKAADPEALVTVGLIQWSIPSLVFAVEHYAAFRPEKIAPFLDFMEVHFYPLDHGFFEYQSPDSEGRNLAYLESVVREVAPFGKPVVLAEFGWYGGGKLTLDQGRHPAATQEQQARWCRRAVEVTQPLACGWLNWGMYDHPEAGDVTQFTGLFTVDGELKAWGRAARDLASGFAKGASCGVGPLPPAKPKLDWDRCTVSPEASKEFRERYFQARKAALLP